MIDTLKVVEQLNKSGFDYEQSKSIAKAIASNNEELVTKQDMQVVRQDIKVLQRDIQGLRWLVGLSLLLNTLAISGIIAILIALANLNI